MSNDANLPIKVVFARKADYLAPSPGGGDWQPFVNITDELRSAFAGQVRQIQQFFDSTFEQNADMLAVAKVELRSQAVAKTYRPTDLFSSDTCPIIGSNRLGELYISVKPEGLRSLSSKIENDRTKKAEAQLSTVSTIAPYSSADALGDTSADELARQSTHTRPKALRLRLFRHADARANGVIDAAFRRLTEEEHIESPEIVDYADGVRVYRVADVPAGAVMRLARFPGTQSLSIFPDYRIVRTASRVIGNVSSTNFRPPDSDKDYPLVGIIDSGTDPNNPQLQAWVADRYDWVPRTRQNNDHGSFVAGLIVHGRRLNNGDSRFPLASSKVVDVVALDRDGEISEYDLLTVIDEALTRFPSVRVWNLSLGMVGTPCIDSEFSLLGAALDDRARKKDVQFVIAAGNYTTSPLRLWPPSKDDEIGENDRICPPADAVRAITVGSLAHLANESSCVRADEPSPFSRRGPGPAYLLKPELVHYGGNCTSDGHYIQTGIISIDGNGHVAENIGTSFATPLVSTVTANAHHELSVDGARVTPSLTKSLLLHGAFMRNSPLDSSVINYCGLGAPAGVEDIVSCTRSSATIIIQAPVQASPTFGKRPFPIPACFANPDSGKLAGEIFMTLLYDPPLDRSHGIEYCRCNVSASLGTVTVDPKTGKEVYERQVGPVPKELTDGYEEELIKHGFKWAPLKLYYRKFSRGPAGRQWRLTLDVLNRADTQLDDAQDVILVITLRADSELVYDQMVQEMVRLNWGAQDLRVRSRLRLQS